MWLIVGLGNPGPGYQNTRHNLGFMALDALALRWKIPFSEAGKYLLLGRGRRRGDSIMLAKPLAYMNRSGEVIGPLATKEKVEASRVLIVVDDLDLPLGTVRFRPRGGTAGHRGMESIVEHLGHEDFARIRLGIGRPLEESMAESDYVLMPFEEGELPLVKKVIHQTVRLAEKVVFKGISDPVTLKINENKEGI
ncbi:aminoacyl-tRNA hydrolase [bacterium]|nr:aminoacyl-tRNA hydrolase [bacterium]